MYIYITNHLKKFLFHLSYNMCLIIGIQIVRRYSQGAASISQKPKLM